MSEATAEAKKEFAKQAVALVFAVVTIAVIMSVQNPDFLRTWRMRLAAASRRHLSFLARRAGHMFMGIELSTGTQQYSLPMMLSNLRDKAAKAYDRAKEH